MRSNIDIKIILVSIILFLKKLWTLKYYCTKILWHTSDVLHDEHKMMWKQVMTSLQMMMLVLIPASMWLMMWRQHRPKAWREGSPDTQWAWEEWPDHQQQAWPSQWLAVQHSFWTAGSEFDLRPATHLEFAEPGHANIDWKYVKMISMAHINKARGTKPKLKDLLWFETFTFRK